MRQQFNLLPDIKLSDIKGQRHRNLTLSISILLSGVSIAVFSITLFTTSVVQRTQIKNLDSDIKTADSKLQGITGLDQVLTVQNQLQSLTQLHANKHISSRIFDYIGKFTPSTVHLSNLDLGLSGNTITISGSADSPLAVNQFVDTLKFTTFSLNGGQAANAFTNVILGSFGGTSGGSFSLTASYAPELFANNTKDSNGNPVVPQLSIPNITTTRSVMDDPTNLLFGGGR